MIANRRTFLTVAGVGLTAAVGGAAYWVQHSPRRVARWLRQMAADTQRPLLPARARPEPAGWPSNGITVGWLGHATVLIRFYDLYILTDPVFSRRIGIDAGLGTLGPKRYVAPALEPGQLPPIDLILLSHAHMDHLDLPSLRRLPPRTPVVTARVTSDLLAKARLREVTELGWGEGHTLRLRGGDLRIEAFEVKHWGRRWPSELERGYNGYVLTREGRSLLFGGDTAYTPQFQAVRRHGPFEAALMPIAAYNPWIRNHCTPEEAVRMADAAGARQFVPIHHATFKLSEEPMDEPLQRLEDALRHEQGRLALRRVGEHVTLA